MDNDMTTHADRLAQIVEGMDGVLEALADMDDEGIEDYRVLEAIQSAELAFVAAMAAVARAQKLLVRPEKSA